MKTAPFFNKMAVIGVGLIGASLSLAMKKKGLVDTVVGIGRGLENLETAKAMGAIDTLTQEVEVGVLDADLVVAAVPVQGIAGVLETAAPYIKKGAIVTDVGSVKLSVIEQVEPLLPKGAYFVPAHPVAGTENSGAAAAFAGLFDGRKCILTPTDGTDEDALDSVRRLWESVGSEVVLMDAGIHDRVFAAVSHLPHVIAYTLVNTVADADVIKSEVLKYTAGGFKDFTRIASSSPEMWRDVCVLNKDQIVQMIDGFLNRLEMLKDLIDGDKEGALFDEFAKAKKIRDSLSPGHAHEGD